METCFGGVILPRERLYKNALINMWSHASIQSISKFQPNHFVLLVFQQTFKEVLLQPKAKMIKLDDRAVASGKNISTLLICINLLYHCLDIYFDLVHAQHGVEVLCSVIFLMYNTLN